MNLAKIKISNFGAIKDVEIRLNRVNVFMGRQSSGKSTIAKIISFCQWVEKRYLLDNSFDYTFEEQFIEFHRIDKEYFKPNSYFEYENNAIKIVFNSEKTDIEINKKEESLEYKKSKNIYIPAERNFVSVIPNLAKFKETNDNIMSFLYDWYDTKKQYSSEKSLKILSLGVNYYHKEKIDDDRLILMKEKKEISLKNASSGLQSVIPLVMITDYLTKTFYENKRVKSVAENEQMNNFIAKILKDERINFAKFFKGNTEDKINQLLRLVKNKFEYHYSNFIIEEPEQNLFPETQKELVYYLIDRVINTDRNHSLTITTHSPYILYAINNCIMADLVCDKLDDKEKRSLKCYRSAINASSISVYEIDDEGRINKIQEEDGLIGDNFFDKQMKKVMDEYYIMLNHY